jgi:hypothetical protein
VAYLVKREEYLVLRKLSLKEIVVLELAHKMSSKSKQKYIIVIC